jgi:hypothetical protein
LLLISIYPFETENEAFFFIGLLGHYMTSGKRGVCFNHA